MGYLSCTTLWYRLPKAYGVECLYDAVKQIEGELQTVEVYTVVIEFPEHSRFPNLLISQLQHLVMRLLRWNMYRVVFVTDDTFTRVLLTGIGRLAAQSDDRYRIARTVEEAYDCIETNSVHYLTKYVTQGVN
ncbi:MAG: hypothetical protein MUF87_16615 [Anaerolineae bacterium]|nr:hypothetical protein [Anaerolineae bacterium]